MVKRHRFHNDPSHGWLEVPRADLEQLGITGEVSGCSYQSGGTVYLEEDRDAQLYLRAARAAGWQVQTDDRSSNGDSFIRQLPCYRP